MTNDHSNEDNNHHVSAQIDSKILPPPGWKYLFAFTCKPHFIALVPAVVLSVADGLVEPAVAIYIGRFFDAFARFGTGEIGENALMRDTLTDVYILITIGGINLVLKGGYFTAWLTFGELQAKAVRDVLFRTLLEKDLEWYDARSTGVETLLARMQT